MRDVELEAMASGHLRAGVRVSGVSIVWTVVSSTVAIVVGLGTGSLVLVVFGAAGLLDAAGSATLVVHFRHALRHEEFSQRHERLALRVVTGGLVVVGGVTAVESARRLIDGVHPHAAGGGVAIAGVSAVVLGWLSHRKRQIARRIPSRALLADGWLSATGALLAVVTVAGTGLTAAFGWWWADPLAAAAVALGAVAIAVVMARNEVEPVLGGSLLGRSVDATVDAVFPFRRQASWVATGGAALAGGTALLAAVRLGGAAPVVLAVIAVVLLTLAVGCRRGWRGALAATGVMLGSQVVDVVGALWAVIVNPEGAKADELRQLGINPRLGFAVNLVYSSLAVALLTVMVLRARTRRRERRAR